MRENRLVGASLVAADGPLRWRAQTHTVLPSPQTQYTVSPSPQTQTTRGPVSSRKIILSGGSRMDKSTAIRLIPGSAVMFRGRRHSIISAKTGLQSEAPFFRLRNLGDGGITGLVSHRMLEPIPEESALKSPAQK